MTELNCGFQRLQDRPVAVMAFDGSTGGDLDDMLMPRLSVTWQGGIENIHCRPVSVLAPKIPVWANFVFSLVFVLSAIGRGTYDNTTNPTTRKALRLGVKLIC